jgi:VanZ family protein
LTGAIALGAAAFTVYGSLVPFNFITRDGDDAWQAFVWAMTHRWWFESRSDAIANVMLGVPLGFGLLGFLRSGRTGVSGDMLAGLVVVPASMLLAVAVEFGQLYVPQRTTSGSDVLCQGLGSIVGIAGWIVCGRWLIEQASAVWSGADSGGRLLMAYLVLLAFVQFLPMDLSASPRDLYRKLRDDVVYVPFSELTEENAWQRGARLIQVLALYVPVGLFASRREFKTWLMLVPVVMEGLQLIVKSRVPSATDSVVGACGIVLGLVLSWRAGLPGRLVLFAVWLASLLVISWQPFVSAAESVPFDWMPGMPLESGHPLFALEEMITKLVLFGLGGALMASSSFARAFLSGIVVSGLCEVGQTLFAGHTPCVTDILLGGIGMMIGNGIRMRMVRE